MGEKPLAVLPQEGELEAEPPGVPPATKDCRGHAAAAGDVLLFGLLHAGHVFQHEVVGVHGVECGGVFVDHRLAHPLVELFDLKGVVGVLGHGLWGWGEECQQDEECQHGAVGINRRLR